MGTEFVWDDEKLLEMDSGDGHTTVNVLNANELYLKMVKMVSFVICLLQ